MFGPMRCVPLFGKLKALQAQKPFCQCKVLNDNTKAFVRLLTIYSNKTGSTVSLTSACAVRYAAILWSHLLRF